jgi:cobalt-zinc-cadmium efflux system outer membrane protein
MALAEIRNQERLLASDVLGQSRELLVLRDKLAANGDIQTILQQLIDVSANRLKAAEISPTDVNLAKLELQRVRLEQAGLLNQHEVATSALNGLLGREPQAPLQMSGDITPAFDADALAKISGEATARRPDRQLVALGLDRAAAEITLARAQKWEDWTVGFEYSRGFSRFGPPVGSKLDNFIGLSVSIPLPVRNNNQGRISEAQATRQRAEAGLSALELRIATETQTAENQMRRLFELLRQYREDTLKLAEENIALLQKGYASGLVGITPVIQAQQQYSELRQGYLAAVAEFVRARTEWETAAR